MGFLVGYYRHTRSGKLYYAYGLGHIGQILAPSQARNIEPAKYFRKLDIKVEVGEMAGLLSGEDTYIIITNSSLVPPHDQYVVYRWLRNLVPDSASEPTHPLFIRPLSGERGFLATTGFDERGDRISRFEYLGTSVPK